MRGWQRRLRKNILNVVERVSVEGVCIPSLSLEIVLIVRIANQRE
jgi:hypothetical protein